MFYNVSESEEPQNSVISYFKTYFIDAQSVRDDFLQG